MLWQSKTPKKNGELGNASGASGQRFSASHSCVRARKYFVNRAASFSETAVRRRASKLSSKSANFTRLAILPDVFEDTPVTADDLQRDEISPAAAVLPKWITGQPKTWISSLVPGYTGGERLLILVRYSYYISVYAADRRRSFWVAHVDEGDSDAKSRARSRGTWDRGGDKFRPDENVVTYSMGRNIRFATDDSFVNANPAELPPGAIRYAAAMGAARARGHATQAGFPAPYYNRSENAATAPKLANRSREAGENSLAAGAAPCRN